MGKIVEDYKDIFGRWRKTLNVDGDKSNTLSGARWMGMNNRCLVGGECQNRRQSYAGCHTSENFKDFQFFAEWHNRSVGYGLEGRQLDKDILVVGNRLYSEGTCVLVPQALNNFLLNRRAGRGIYRQGVSLDAKNRKYKSSISINGRNFSIGRFITEDEAYAAYKEAKEAEAYRWYERLKAGEFIVDERVIERMRTWTLEE